MLFDRAKRSRSQEAFLSVVLLSVLGISAFTEAVGLSATLGAFLAGVSLAETAYANQVEASVAPLRGLLLGLFFVTVGFSIDVSLLGGTASKDVGTGWRLGSPESSHASRSRETPETVDTDGAANRCIMRPERRIRFCRLWSVTQCDFRTFPNFKFASMASTRPRRRRRGRQRVYASRNVSRRRRSTQASRRSLV